MERVTEPELMDEVGQARAYSEADFSDPHQAVVAHFTDRFADFPVNIAELSRFRTGKQLAAAGVDHNCGFRDPLIHDVLVTVGGERHTAFAAGNSCVDDAVVRYFVNLTVPADGTRC